MKLHLIAAEIAREHKIEIADLRGRCLSKPVKLARIHAYSAMWDAGYASNVIAKYFKVDGSSVRQGAKAWREKTGTAKDANRRPIRIKVPDKHGEAIEGANDREALEAASDKLLALIAADLRRAA